MEKQVLPQLDMLQRMINLKVQNLKDLRDKQQQDSKSDIITSEISDLEGKLVMLFANQIVTKIKFSHSTLEHTTRFYPRLKQFLFVVGLDEDMIHALEERCSTVEELFLFSDEKLAGIFYVHDDNEDTKKKLDGQYKRVRMARNIMQNYVFRLQNGEKRSDLQWASWDDTVPDSPSLSVRSSIASFLSVFSYTTNDEANNYKSRSIPPSPSPARSFAIIPRSRSDDANVGQRIHTESTSSAGSTSSSSRYIVKSENLKRKKKPEILTIPPSTDGETDSEHSTKSRSSSMSQSPRTPTIQSNFLMGHSIKHRFSGKQLLVSIACGYCYRVMLFGLKCKECGFKCHKKCSRKVPPSCGLPDDLLKVFKDTVDKERVQGDDHKKLSLSLPQSNTVGLVPIKRTNSEPSNFANRIRVDKHMSSSHGSLMHNTVNNGAGGIGSSTSADAYSTASSTSSISSSTFHSDSPLGTPNLIDGGDQKQEGNFRFFQDGESLGSENSLLDTLTSTTSTISTINSEASTNTLIDTKSSSDTAKSSSTLSIQEEEGNSVDDLDVQISDIHQHVKLRQTSLSKGEKLDRMMSMHNHGSLMSEWVIPFSQIEISDQIGTGRVGKVYKAKWHGECALKVLYLENPTTEEKNDFKYKVQVLRRTRHENLVLFMGACMEPPTLAIVCSLIKGLSLYSHIHVHNTKFDDIKIISIVQQIAQGMSYLHARKIVHKDLKSKNIFLEQNQNRIVITDFGLLSIADIKVTNTRNNYLIVPKGWLCYQAPEIIRCLSALDPGCEVLHYTKESDIYAFGSVWYELLAGHWPFAKHPNESIIWQIGKGVKQGLKEIELGVTREIKDIISMTWALDPEIRPQFSTLLKAFERLPKRRLIRSPSQPTYMTRSANALLI